MAVRGETSGKLKRVTPGVTPRAPEPHVGQQPVPPISRDDLSMVDGGHAKDRTAGDQMQDFHSARLEAVREQLGELPPEYQALKPGQEMTAEHLKQFVDLEKVSSGIKQSLKQVQEVDMERLKGIFINVPRDARRGVMEPATVYHRFTDEELQNMKAIRRPATPDMVLKTQLAIGAAPGSAKENIRFMAQDYEQNTNQTALARQSAMVYRWVDGSYRIMDMSPHHGINLAYEKANQPAEGVEQEQPRAEISVEQEQPWEAWEREPMERVTVINEDAAKILGNLMDPGAEIPGDPAAFNEWVNKGYEQKDMQRSNVRKALEKINFHTFSGEGTKISELTAKRLDRISHTLEMTLNPKMEMARVSDETQSAWEEALLKGEAGGQELLKKMLGYQKQQGLIEATPDPADLQVLPNAFARDNGLRSEYVAAIKHKEATGDDSQLLKVTEAYHRWLIDARRKLAKLIEA
ncbi:MAG: hypothetical protein ABIG66_00980 [Candidatus Kerfeldbacteria bacterium]